MLDKDQKEFTFMNEQFKKKPFYKKKGFIKVLSVGVLAILFGIVSGFSFAILQPWAQKQFGDPEELTQIVVVQEETETETQKQTEAELAGQTEMVMVPEKKELEISDYKVLYKKMSKVAEGVMPSIVTVTGESSKLDWFSEVIENHVQTSGLVIAQGKQEYFILTEAEVIEGAERIIVTFPEGNAVEAQVQKKDRATGIAVLSVAKDSLSSMDKSKISVAELCCYAEIKRGEPVIAVTSPVGNNSSIAFGMVTSVMDTAVVDAEYKILNTDILGNENGSGILINLDGKIVGVIAQEFATNSDQITLTSLSVMDIQDLITNLVNNKDIAYLGIVGKEIDETISKGFDMPQGIYVRSVTEDSPAMYANLVTADIITSINGREIMTMEDYVEELKRHVPNEMVKIGIKRSAMDGYVDMEIQVQLGRG